MQHVKVFKESEEMTIKPAVFPSEQTSVGQIVL